MKARIAKLLSTEGLSANKFAEIVGVQASGVSHILSGRNKPGYDLIVKILAKFPNISPDWLLLGEGGMYRNNVDSSGKSLATEAEPNRTDDVVKPSAATEPSKSNEPTLFDHMPRPYGASTPNVDATAAAAAAIADSSVEATNKARNTNYCVTDNRVDSADLKASYAEIERVMIFYSDNTVSTYTIKK